MGSRRRNSRPEIRPRSLLTKGPAPDADPGQSSLENPETDYALPTAATHQSPEHTHHFDFLLAPKFPIVAVELSKSLLSPQCPGSPRRGKSSNSMPWPWESMAAERWGLMRLEIPQRDQSNLQCCADRLATVGGVQLPKDVVKMSLDGRRGQTQIHSQPFCGVALGYASQNLHLP
jgi:hypothetical protein